jgi:hypothetical protein
MTNVIPFPTQPQGDFLPVTLGGGDLRCSRCGTVWHPRTWHVSPGSVANPDAGTATTGTPVCPDCARQDPALAAWQHWCDATDSIDAAMVAAGTFRQRVILNDMVEHYAGHLARWRADAVEMAQWEKLDRDRIADRYGPLLDSAATEGFASERTDPDAVVGQCPTTDTIRQTARAVVTATVDDDIDLAARLAWEVSQHPQAAVNAMLHFAHLLDVTLDDHAQVSGQPAADLWCHVVQQVAQEDLPGWTP